MSHDVLIEALDTGQAWELTLNGELEPVPR